MKLSDLWCGCTLYARVFVEHLCVRRLKTHRNRCKQWTKKKNWFILYISWIFVFIKNATHTETFVAIKSFSVRAQNAKSIKLKTRNHQEIRFSVVCLSVSQSVNALLLFFSSLNSKESGNTGTNTTHRNRSTHHTITIWIGSKGKKTHTTNDHIKATVQIDELLI